MPLNVSAATPFERQNLLSEFQRLTAEASPWRDPVRLEQLYINLQALEDDGLTPDHYDIPLVAQQILHLVDTEAVYPPAPDEVALSAAYLNALMDLQLGRTHGSGVENYLNYRNQMPDPHAQILDLAIEGLKDIDQAFSQARPDTLTYTNLRKAYQQLRKQTAEQPLYSLFTRISLLCARACR
ncbi:hypothetical protein [Nitrincola sp. A-D6]|uniref:hypothetical protein n=1 Tax=Nitrincola sp. A-D6 TaxID=1545442 RepID=UPI00068E807B|nr:hypothetical protein [Nitrincola sp. A-D6]